MSRNHDRDPRGADERRPPEHAAPPDGTRPGAWEVEPGRVRFALWAPWKQRVAVIGDFNGWDETAAPLAVGDDGTWWVELDLDPGEHRYLFVIDDGDRIGDPYAVEVDWTERGPQGVVRVGETPFEWHDGDYRMPPVESWVIYEAHVGDMTPEGTFAALTDKLDHLQHLGINALELMPIFEFPGDRSWGYNPVYGMAPEQTYGTPRELRTLIDEAHRRGIAVVLDMVFNHVADEHPFVSLYPYDENPFFSGDGNPWGFPDLDHWSDAVKAFVHRVQTYWLETMHIDGFRYDATAFIGYDDLSGVAFIAHDARETQPHVRLIAEQIPEDPDLLRSTEIDAAWHERWHHILKAQLREGEFEGVAYGDMDALTTALFPADHGYGGALEVINYLESHDQERVIREVQSNPDAAPRALQRSVLGAAMLFTAPGTPMLWMGQEFATAIPKEVSLEGAKLGWDAFEDEGVRWLHGCYQRLVWLRREHPALRTDRVEVWLADPERRLLAYRRSAVDEDAEVLVFLNFAPDEQGFDIELPRGGRYHEVLTEADWELDGGPYATTIPGSTARVLERVAG